MLAGPSECLVIADDTADPAVIAADLLAQAEHDVDAVPILVTTSSRLADAVDAALEAQLQVLSTAPVARAAVAKGGIAVITPDLATSIRISDVIAPEHLEVRGAGRTDVKTHFHTPLTTTTTPFVTPSNHHHPLPPPTPTRS